MNAKKIQQDTRSRAQRIAEGAEQLDAHRVGSLAIVAADEGRGVSVDPAAMRTALAGTPYADLVRDPVKPHTALTRAIGNAKKGIRDDGFSSFWTRAGTTSDDVLVFALMRKSTDVAQREVATEVAATVEVHKDGAGGLSWHNRITLTDAEHEERARVDGRYQKERGFLTLNDVRHLVNTVALKRLRGVRIGGTTTFLLPEGDDATFMSIASALTLSGVRVTPQEVFSGQRGGYTHDVHASLMDDVATLRARCEERLETAREAAKEGNGRRFVWATIAERRKEAEELMQRVRFFEAFVGIVGDDIRAACESAQAVLNDTELAAAHGLASLAD